LYFTHLFTFKFTADKLCLLLVGGLMGVGFPERNGQFET
jgi:hypothetical protein